MSLPFTIVLPVYNVAAYLETCLESIATQTFKDFEVILVDDGSTDQSGEICDTFAKKDERFHVIHKRNEGVSIARNDGLRLAKGQYVYVMDSDDWLAADTLQCIYAESASYKYDTFVFGMVKHRQHSGSTSTSDYIPPSLDIRESKGKEKLYTIYARGCGYSHWTSVFNREFLAKHGIVFQQIKRNEDMNFMLDVFTHAESIRAIDRPFYNYRIFSAVHKFNEYAIDNHAKLFAKFYGLMNHRCGSKTSNTLLRVYLTWFMHAVPTNFVRTPHLSRAQKIGYLRAIYDNDTVSEYLKKLTYSRSTKLNCLFFLFRMRSPVLLYLITRMRFLVSNLVPVNIRN